MSELKKDTMLRARGKKTDKMLYILILLLAIFLLRVIAQVLQYYFNLPFIPSFNEWDSGILPYSILLPLQLIILLVFAKIIYRISSGKFTASLITGYILIISGSIYFLVMLFRCIAGLTVLEHVRWFAYPIPSFFHMVLAAFLILYGYCHLSKKGGVVK